MILRMFCDVSCDFQTNRDQVRLAMRHGRHDEPFGGLPVERGWQEAGDGGVKRPSFGEGRMAGMAGRRSGLEKDEQKPWHRWHMALNIWFSLMFEMVLTLF